MDIFFNMWSVYIFFVEIIALSLSSFLIVPLKLYRETLCYQFGFDFIFAAILQLKKQNIPYICVPFYIVV